MVDKSENEYKQTGDLLLMTSSVEVTHPGGQVPSNVSFFPLIILLLHDLLSLSSIT